MTVLAIETSGKVCSASLIKDGAPIDSYIEYETGNHARCLPVFIDSLLSRAKDETLSIDAVALSEGPGSYTGLRIGASMAKGLCYGMNIPLIVLPTTMVLCAAFMHDNTILPNDAILCPMIDARRMEVYTAFYDQQYAAQTSIEAKIIDDQSFLSLLASQTIIFFGDGAAKCKAVIQNDNATFIDNVVADARYMGMLVEKGLGNCIKGKEIAYYTPFYLKDFIAAPSHVKGL